MDHLLPVELLAENDHWIAFQHPQPDYALHILIVPREAIPNLTAASLDSGEPFIALFNIVQTLIAKFNLEKVGYRLITNGGPNQTIPQWHWHLVSAAWQEAHV
jgi:histidine triad (HIT) family protein